MKKLLQKTRNLLIDIFVPMLIVGAILYVIYGADIFPVLTLVYAPVVILIIVLPRESK